MSRSHVRILLIDDDEHARALLVRVLERAGNEVHALADGRRLAEVLETHEVDVVLSDVYMPEVDGFQALRVLQSKYPELPVVVISGGSGALDNCLHMAAMLGAAAVLEKPVRVPALLETLRSVTASGRPRAAPRAPQP